MIMGDRGTGKSTTIRALADLLPDITIIKNDPFNTDPKGLSKEYETEEIKSNGDGTLIYINLKYNKDLKTIGGL